MFTVDGWFGSGIDYVSDFMSNYLVGVPKGYTGGGLFSYAVEYGFLPFIVFVIITFQLCYDKENKIPTTLFWVFSILLVGINSQLAWSTIILLYIIKYTTIMNILVLAYLLSPSKGSEYSVAWNYVTHMSKKNNLTVLYGASGNQMGGL